MFSLSEMPELVLENIIWFSDFRSVLTLRQVCRYFRNFIDDLNDSKLPDSEISGIVMIANADIRLTYEMRNRPQHDFIYSNMENSRIFNDKTTILENVNIVDVAVRDLEQMLKFQKSELLEGLFIELVNGQLPEESPFSSLPDKLSDMFRKLNRKIKTTGLFITFDNQSGFMSILPFADPETLKEIQLYPPDENTEIEIEIDEIVKTEQWKNAETIYCSVYALNMKVEDICHFSEVFMRMLSISARDLDFLRQMYVGTSKYQSFEFRIKNFNEKEELYNTWGIPFISEDSSCWYFKMQHSEEEYLKIEFTDWPWTTFSFDVVFSANILELDE